MTEYALVLLFAAALTAVALVPVARQGVQAFGRRIDRELADGNLALRRDKRIDLNRHGITHADFVAPAETMPGYVWFVMRHDPPDDPVEHKGWALTRGMARQAARNRIRKTLVRQ